MSYYLTRSIANESRLCCRHGGNQFREGKNDGLKIIGIKPLKPKMKVYKYGRTTNETTGEVNGCVVQVWEKGEVTSEIGILGEGEKFAECGDSGSLVVTEGEDGIYAVGMLVGKNTAMQLALVTPLWAILKDVQDKGLMVSLEVVT
jgi:hypothetical protein